MSQSSRRRARRQPEETFPPIRDMGDGFALAAGLHVRFRRSRACFVCSPGGAVEQGWALTLKHHTLDDALALAMAVPDDWLAGRRILLVSTNRRDDVTVLAEEDVATWHRLRHAAAERGALAVDWIQAGGDNFRSMLLSTDPDAEWII